MDGDIEQLRSMPELEVDLAGYREELKQVLNVLLLLSYLPFIGVKNPDPSCFLLKMHTVSSAIFSGFVYDLCEFGTCIAGSGVFRG